MGVMANAVEWVEVTPGDCELEDAYEVLAAAVGGHEQFLVALGEADPDDADEPQMWTVYAVSVDQTLTDRGVYASLEEAQAAVESELS